LTEQAQTPDRAALLARIDARTQDTLGHLLTRSARLFNEQAVAAVQAAGYPEVRESWVGLLRHLEPDGVRSSVLGDRLGITKQAAGQLVSDLERVGYLERVPDPSDGRAKLVRMTDRGFGAWLAGLDALHTLESELHRVVGLEGLRRDAPKLLAALVRRGENT
jgi:DNA-binding MarR family transcriptional regulator